MAKTVDEVADAMFQLVEEAQGVKKLKPMDLTKSMMEMFGDEVDKKLCKEAIKQLDRLREMRLHVFRRQLHRDPAQRGCCQRLGQLARFSDNDHEFIETCNRRLVR